MSDIAARLTAALTDRYEIERELGEGGMATVYLARDLRHNRQVALKVLKPELAAVVGAERFLTEIETTANLQHPHILPLFDSGNADSFLFYVMPYIDGETLQDRIDRDKQLPVDEAVGIAIALSNALQTAHEAGVIHRDIKPANILMSRGEPLIADFGIALAVGAAGGNRMTETGLSLGTPFYMSPEQATGDQSVGPASDTYAVACVLYEMLTGDPPYQGNSAQAVLGKIIQGAPPSPTEARPSIPRNVSGAILKGLEKIPADRFSSMKEFAAALSNPAFRYGEADTTTAGAGRRWTRLTSVFAGSTLILAALAGWAVSRSPSSPEVTQFALELPEAVSEDIDLGDRGRVALSPDGRRLAFVGPAIGAGSQLWLKQRDQLEARPIPGTEGAIYPSFSPNGEHLAFTTYQGGVGQLRRVPLDGGPSFLVSDSLIDNGGISWGWDGFIYTDAALEGDGFARVPEDGGSPEIVTRPAPGENWHAAPFALPNGKGVLFYVNGPEAVAVVDLETGEYTALVDGLWGGYVRSGHLVWVTRDGTLMAQPFDQNSFELSGRPTPIVEGLLVPTIVGGANVALSLDGDLVYMTGRRVTEEATVVWTDRSGQVAEFDSEWVRRFEDITLSPDGSRMAVSIAEGEGSHIWVRSITGGPARKLTFDGSNEDPTWLPDSDWIAYVSGMRDVPGVYRRRADGTGGEELVMAFDANNLVRPRWSPDGRWLTFSTRSERALVGQPLGSDGLPEGETVVLANDSDGLEASGAVSPDGRWIAYFSVGEGRPNIRVRPFPDTDGGNWLVSENLAVFPSWSADGRELFFRDIDEQALTSVSIISGTTFEYGAPVELFGLDDFSVLGAVPLTPDGERFLMLRRADSGEAANQKLILVQNFGEQLRQRVGN